MRCDVMTLYANLDRSLAGLASTDLVSLRTQTHVYLNISLIFACMSIGPAYRD